MEPVINQFLTLGCSQEDFKMSGLKHLLQFEMSLMSPGVQENFLSGSYSSKHEDCLNMSCCGSFSEICIKSSSFNFQGIRKRAILVLRDSKSKGWEKIVNIKEL